MSTESLQSLRLQAPNIRAMPLPCRLDQATQHRLDQYHGVFRRLEVVICAPALLDDSRPADGVRQRYGAVVRSQTGDNPMTRARQASG